MPFSGRTAHRRRRNGQFFLFFFVFLIRYFSLLCLYRLVVSNQVYPHSHDERGSSDFVEEKKNLFSRSQRVIKSNSSSATPLYAMQL